METGKIVRIMREKKGYSQVELAALVGYKDRSSIAKIESGQADLPQSKIISLSRILGVSPVSLIGLTDDIVEAKNDSTTLPDDELTRSIYSLLGQLTQSDLEKVSAFLQGLLAAR